jgi:phosphoribosylformylglycinamidine (FGAM) synthase PurS component
MVFDVHVEIRGLDGIVDPEGRMIERALPALGFRGIAACG